MQITKKDSRIILSFPYNRRTISIVKSCTDSRWDPSSRTWSVKESERTRYCLEEILPRTEEFKKYYLPIPEQTFLPKYKILWKPQKKFAEAIVHLKRVIGAIEMRAGKTLAVFAAVDLIKPKSYYWFASKSALRSLRIQLNTWRPYRTPDIIDSYASLSKYSSPQVVVFDESMALKTHSSKRTREAQRIADGAEYVVLLTGTPAPQDFGDWYSQCEVCRPGLIKEKNYYKFIERYAIINLLYFTAESWRQEEIKQFPKRVGNLIHTYYRRDLGKVFNIEYIEIEIPTRLEDLKIAGEIANQASSAITALSQLRQLSDGFLYQEKTSLCPCVPPCCLEQQVCFEQELPYCSNCMKKFYLQDCKHCRGAGLRSKRTTKIVHDYKLRALKRIADGLKRLVVYGAFTETLQRIGDFLEDLGWSIIRIDGKGMRGGVLEDFNRDCPGKVAIVAHPACGGEGLDLSASQTIVYYSNTFKASERWQSQDRCLSPTNSVKVYDLLYLPSDKQVLDNLQKKRRGQELTLEQIRIRIIEASD